MAEAPELVEYGSIVDIQLLPGKSPIRYALTIRSVDNSLVKLTLKFKKYTTKKFNQCIYRSKKASKTELLGK